MPEPLAAPAPTLSDRVRAVLVRRRRFLTFCAAGGSGVLVNMAIYLLVLGAVEDFGLSGLVAVNVAALAGWIVSVASNFALNDRLTFRQAGGDYARTLGHRLLRYYASASVAFAVQAAVLNGILLALDTPALAAFWQSLQEALDSAGLPGTSLLRWRRTSANLVGIGVATIVNYVLARNWVFRKE